ncbi:hypothetical protein HYV84_02015 [Candidatus Woesearchaeota archaeon]|nr:hypothetical protein [Candidatus Woesearchaeota archaeon]
MLGNNDGEARSGPPSSCKAGTLDSLRPKDRNAFFSLRAEGTGTLDSLRPKDRNIALTPTG